MALPLDVEELPRNDKGTAELPLVQQISISIDLLSTAKHFLSFLESISGLPQLHGGSLAVRAIRRYLNCWMPLVAKNGLHTEKNLLPPLDVQWVWLCHRLTPKSYQCYCKTHYGKLIDDPIFLELSSYDAARQTSRQLWNESYSSEPFEMEPLHKNGQSNRKSQASELFRPSPVEEKELMESVSSQIAFYNQVSQQYMQQDEFLTVAKDRYLCFLYMLQRFEGRTACIPTCDILLMLKCHQTSPAGYAHDTQAFLGNLKDDQFVIHQQLSNTTLQDFEETSRTWELLFGRPYERAGVVWPQSNNVDEATPLDPLFKSIPITINWHHQSFDINIRHAILQPRYVREVCVHVKSAARRENSTKRADQLFLRMQTIDACRNVKHHVSVERYRHDTVWHKLWCMQCEASTKGIVVDLMSNGTACLIAPFFSKLLGQVTLSWKELEEELLLESTKSLTRRNTSHLSDTWIILTSITPLVQAPYLLKALLDRVTDNSGAMISKKVLKLNKNKPQEGRWMTRTVLDHAGRECFIIRIRIATGVWRSKLERPVGVDWNERTLHIHRGGWNYISGSTGIAPEEVLATATPLDDEREQYKMKWSFSTGETLTIQMPIENLEWERHLRFSLKGNGHGVIRLLNGRHMQYEVPSSVPEEEEGFVTLVRYTAEARQGRATALFNWKLLAMEVLPEEDVVLVLLICVATQRAVADLGAKTVRNFYRRKHVKSVERHRNWGSVVMGGGQEVPSELAFWYVNPEEVLGVDVAEVENEEVLPKGASEHMYRGTSWLYTGSMKGLYKMSSKGSCESFSYDTGDHHHSLAGFGSQTKVPAATPR